MIAVIFEVKIKIGKKADYLAIAAELKSVLEKIDGFISIERFQSLSDPEKLLSLSIWRDEESIKEWRTLTIHRNAQSKGIEIVFEDYQLRIAEVTRAYGMNDRKQAPNDSANYHLV